MASLNPAAMEALVHTDYQTVEEARDILLRREAKLVDMAARRKSTWQTASAGSHRASATATTATAGAGAPSRSAPPAAPADPNAMDVDRAKVTAASRKCYKCGQAGHLIAQCPLWMESIKAVVLEAVANGRKEEEPKPGFV
ncbi:hypothetical protein C0993_002485 [Termitomyces sp. T159_Od127]|nr:hypothetical protein C0993_002485 [Termitomyces sp. T159_Od127]